MGIDLSGEKAGAMAECRSCKAEITWARTRAGKAIPIDPDPRSDGNVVIEADGAAVYLGADSTYTGERFVSHWVTCPDAESWRKKR
jgi:hypothetical protein